MSKVSGFARALLELMVRFLSESVLVLGRSTLMRCDTDSHPFAPKRVLCNLARLGLRREGLGDREERGPRLVVSFGDNLAELVLQDPQHGGLGGAAFVAIEDLAERAQVGLGEFGQV